VKPGYERRRVMIWGKTYPELSSHHTETVCTGAVDMMTGAPLRLYPVPLRYLRESQQYSLYDVYDVDIIKNPKDSRPESYKVEADSLVKVETIKTDRQEWAERRRRIFADQGWHFDSMAALEAAQEAGTHSMGVIRPGSIVSVKIRPKPAKDAADHERKWDEVTAQHDLLFRKEYRELEFIPVTIRIEWQCHDMVACRCRKRPHNVSVIDWGLIELGRREGWEKARAHLADLADLDTHDFRLFMGNMVSHPQTFVVIGLWYPKLREQIPMI